MLEALRKIIFNNQFMLHVWILTSTSIVYESCFNSHLCYILHEKTIFPHGLTLPQIVAELSDVCSSIPLNRCKGSCTKNSFKLA